MFTFLSGVPKVVVPDNLKSVTSKVGGLHLHHLPNCQWALLLTSAIMTGELGTERQRRSVPDIT